MISEEDAGIEAEDLARLRSEIRLLEERLAATAPSDSPLSEHAARIVRGDLARLQEQFDRMIKASPK